jgi:AraC family transcriptional regulator, ethanolamine operon transcriptional activator
MLFKKLHSSPVLELVQYPDIDAFRGSERYVGAQSIPLDAERHSVLRASLSFVSSSLSLVRTFPRIIKGYELSNRLLIVIPMDKVSSARINGNDIGQSLLFLSGSEHCTVHEPESRLVAIVSMSSAMFMDDWRKPGDAGRRLWLPDEKLAELQSTIRGLLESAAREPEAMQAPIARQIAERHLLAEIGDATRIGTIASSDRIAAHTRYRQIVDRLDQLVQSNPTTEIGYKELSDITGASPRTLHNALQQVCGLSPHRYLRIRRLWMVRSQLRSGSPGLTIKSSAQAHGFHHMGEFSAAYKATFGETPSDTLFAARNPLIRSD